jgi:hypothetical protein
MCVVQKNGPTRLVITLGLFWRRNGMIRNIRKNVRRQKQIKRLIVEEGASTVEGLCLLLLFVLNIGRLMDVNHL